jgi:hypothetical protein
VSDLWPKFTRENPCPACQHWDWTCRRGDKGYVCMRVQSAYPMRDGGWFHPFDDAKPVPPPPPRRRHRPPPTLDAAALLAEWASETTEDDLDGLAMSLGVSVDSVRALGAVRAFWRAGLWSLERFPARGWGFPMRDGAGNIIGIRVRSDDGRKWAVTGSRGGLFIPDQPGNFRGSHVMLPEGPTSTAAALTLGYFAIGRPSCNAGGDMVRECLHRLGIYCAVIVADNDDKPNGLRPGLQGAEKLASEIGVRSVIWSPQTKDIRDYLRLGGTRDGIESDLKNFVWRKL